MRNYSVTQMFFKKNSMAELTMDILVFMMPL